MKKSLENRYPNSAELFRFCKEALSVKHSSEVKVIDQHVGAILGYDPADCSHWKKGKKNIKSLNTISTIAKHLEIDPGYVADLVMGKSNLEETLQEFKGYAPQAVSQKFHDEVKRDFFQNPQRYQSNGEKTSFEQYLNLDRSACQSAANRILSQAQVFSCPVMLPEIAQVLAPKVTITFGGSHGEVALHPQSALANPTTQEQSLAPTEKHFFQESPSQKVSVKVTQTTAEGTYEIRCNTSVMRPYLRTLIAREIGKILFAQSPDDLTETNELLMAKANLFAGFLLVPGSLLQRAMLQVNVNQDIVDQLSEMFWVGRTMINARLKDFVEHGD